MRPVAARKLSEVLGEMEAERNAPIRVIFGREGGRALNRIHSWNGESGNVEHYQPGTTSDDLRESGITIISHGYNDALNPTGVRYESISSGLLVDEWRRNYNANEYPTCKFRVNGPDEGAIEGAGGIPLKLDDKLIGEIYDNGRALFTHFNFTQIDGYGLPNFEPLLLGPLREFASPEAIAAARQRNEERQRQVFARMMQERGDAALVNINQERDQVAGRLGTVQEEMVNLNATRDQLDAQLAYLLAQRGEMEAEAIDREWSAITRNVNVERFTIGQDQAEVYPRGMQANTWLKVYTKDLWFTNPENNRKMPLGKFEIKMNFGANTLEIHNITNQQQGNNNGGVFNANENTKWDHPHVREGKLCTAEFATAITQQLRDRQLAGMTNMLFTILRTVTLEDNWGRNNVLLWEQADDRYREQNNWPAWTPDETEHPALADAQEETNNGN
jgi:hypothetical protein